MSLFDVLYPLGFRSYPHMYSPATQKMTASCYGKEESATYVAQTRFIGKKAGGTGGLYWAVESTLSTPVSFDAARNTLTWLKEQESEQGGVRLSYAFIRTGDYSLSLADFEDESGIGRKRVEWVFGRQAAPATLVLIQQGTAKTLEVAFTYTQRAALVIRERLIHKLLDTGIWPS